MLVSDNGDGRAAIYSKNSATSADWSDPAYVTGGSIDVTVGAVSELAFGETPTVEGTPGAGSLELAFGLPSGPEISIGTVTRGEAAASSAPATGGYALSFVLPSQEAQGAYSGETAYVKGDVVQDNGSSWVALQATTGNAPPTLPTTSNAYWQLLARAGNDGAGTVTSLAGGTGIQIDSTDPTVPVIAAVVASQAEAEAGTEAAKLMTPDRTAQAIAEQAAPDAYRPSNILGTVTQAGGVPTGAIIERGSNANGEYVRYADGTQICWGSGTVDASNDQSNHFGSTSGAARSGNAAITFPSAFIDDGYTLFPVPTFRGFTVLGAYGKTASGAAFRMGVSGTTTADVPFDWEAIGRWF